MSDALLELHLERRNNSSCVGGSRLDLVQSLGLRDLLRETHPIDARKYCTRYTFQPKTEGVSTLLRLLDMFMGSVTIATWRC